MPSFFYRLKGAVITTGPFPSEKKAAEAAIRAGLTPPDVELLDGKHQLITSGDAIKEAVDLVKKLDE